MPLIDRKQDTPKGLTRFLRGHEGCPRGLEVERDDDLVTVICRGCEASFAYVTSAERHQPTEVEQALRHLAGAVEDPPRAKAPPATAPTPVRRAPRASRLPPPGPLAPRRRRSSRLAAASRVSGAVSPVVDAISRRRRPIATAALALTGAYILLGLGADSEPSSSDPIAPGDADLPLQAGNPGDNAGAGDDSAADTARTLESPEAGGPDAEPFTGPGGRYEVSLPAGWEQSETERGSARLESADESARVLIRVETGADGVGDLADRAAEILAGGGSKVERVPSRSEGELLAVARASDDGDLSTAYIADAGGIRYLVVSEHSAASSALVRLQEQEIVRSFRTLPGS